ncbi:protein of unknown function [Ralstonia solanacearum CMR15]|nr:protein of unknown function [Ralstonia solanacearum CMR15]
MIPIPMAAYARSYLVGPTYRKRVFPDKSAEILDLFLKAIEGGRDKFFRHDAPSIHMLAAPAATLVWRSAIRARKLG